MEPENHLFEKEKSSSKPPFLGSMLIFRGGTLHIWEKCETPSRPGCPGTEVDGSMVIGSTGEITPIQYTLT